MAKDRFKIDSHKLMYHVDRLVDWCGGKMIYPVYTIGSYFGGPFML